MSRRSVLPTSQRQGAHFEQLHVQKVYDEIAATVNDIQHKAWPNVKRFLKKLPSGSLIADIGCGNGRYLNVNKKIVKVGVDICQPLVNRARLKGYEVAYGDNLQVPFRDGVFDGVVSIGVIHHFSSHERRVQALKELARVLRPGGKLMIYVWAYEQKHRKFEGQDVLVPWHEGLKEIRRTGSASSRHSSVGGMSSTSSVSEDDSIDQFSTTDKDSYSPKVRCRQSSVSLEDLTSISEQRDFKKSYYSLDFSGSSPVHQRSKAYSRGTSMTERRSGSREHKETVISECRKLEASLRAMSTGNLEEMRRKAISRELVRDIDETNTQKEVFDFKGLNIEEYESPLRDDKPKDIFELFEDADGTIDDIPGSAEEFQDIVNKLSENDLSVNCYKDTHERRKKICSKVNPFLKQNSLDPYTFNEVIPKSEKDSLNELTKVAEFVEDDADTLDEVFVNFRPEHPELEVKPSFFSSVKSRFLSMFDGNNEKVTKKTGNISKSFDANDGKDCSFLKVMPRSLSRPEFTMEQINKATLLNFRVREFPLSSYPEQISQENEFVTQNNETSDYDEVNAKNNNECPLVSVHSHSNEKALHHCKNQNKLLHHLSNDSDCLNVAKAFLKSDVVSDEYVEVIYDGYIKIDLSKVEDKQSAFDTEADDNRYVSSTDDNPYNESINADSISESNRTEDHVRNGCNKENTFEVSGQLDDCSNISAQSIDDVYEENMESDTFYTQGITKNQTTPDESAEMADGDDVLTSKLCRFYHVFQEGELDELIANHVPELQVLQCFYDHANWCIVAEKISHEI